MKLVVIRNRKIISLVTKTLRTLTLFFVLISLFLFIIIVFIKIDFVAMNFLKYFGLIGFSTIILWIFINMITSYFEIGQIVLTSENIETSVDDNIAFKIAELKDIQFNINEYAGQSYGPRTLSVFQGVNNTLKFTHSDICFEYKVLIKGKSSLNSFAALAEKWKLNGVEVRLYFRGKEVNNFEFL